MTNINDATSWSITLRIIIYTSSVVDYTPSKHLQYRLHLQSSFTIAKIIVQATGVLMIMKKSFITSTKIEEKKN